MKKYSVSYANSFDEAYDLAISLRRLNEEILMISGYEDI